MNPITLETLPQASAQEVFDHVATHLMTQGKRSTSDNGGTCLHRSPSGFMDAAGCLIADNEHTAGMEAQSWDLLVEEGVVPNAHHELIARLEVIHDESLPEMWKAELRTLASRFELSGSYLEILELPPVKHWRQAQ